MCAGTWSLTPAFASHVWTPTGRVLTAFRPVRVSSAAATSDLAEVPWFPRSWGFIHSTGSPGAGTSLPRLPGRGPQKGVTWGPWSARSRREVCNGWMWFPKGPQGPRDAVPTPCPAQPSSGQWARTQPPLPAPGLAPAAPAQLLRVSSGLAAAGQGGLPGRPPGPVETPSLWAMGPPLRPEGPEAPVPVSESPQQAGPSPLHGGPRGPWRVGGGGGRGRSWLAPRHPPEWLPSPLPWRGSRRGAGTREPVFRALPWPPPPPTQPPWKLAALSELASAPWTPHPHPSLLPWEEGARSARAQRLCPGLLSFHTKAGSSWGGGGSLAAAPEWKEAGWGEGLGDQGPGVGGSCRSAPGLCRSSLYELTPTDRVGFFPPESVGRRQVFTPRCPRRRQRSPCGHPRARRVCVEGPRQAGPTERLGPRRAGGGASAQTSRVGRPCTRLWEPERDAWGRLGASLLEAVAGGSPKLLPFCQPLCLALRRQPGAGRGGEGGPLPPTQSGFLTPRGPTYQPPWSALSSPTPPPHPGPPWHPTPNIPHTAALLPWKPPFLWERESSTGGCTLSRTLGRPSNAAFSCLSFPTCSQGVDCYDSHGAVRALGISANKVQVPAPWARWAWRLACGRPEDPAGLRLAPPSAGPCAEGAQGVALGRPRHPYTAWTALCQSTGPTPCGPVPRGTRTPGRAEWGVRPSHPPWGVGWFQLSPNQWPKATLRSAL